MASGDRHKLFCVAVSMGSELVAGGRKADGVGTGCQQLRPDFHGVGNECGVSRLCYSRGMGDCSRDTQRRMAATLVEAVGAGATGHSAPLVCLVLTDRGLYANWLYRAIRSYRWHPFMRINTGGQYRTRREKTWRGLSSVVKQTGTVVARRVVCFKTVSPQLPCTLLACWQAAYTDPWLIITDLPVTRANVVWYAMRAWIESGFKDFKRDGWRWEQTKMTRPERAERLWLVMAVATLWVVSVGGEADLELSPSTLPSLTTQRCLSCFALGLNRILKAVCQQLAIPVGRFFPEPWSNAPT